MLGVPDGELESVNVDVNEVGLEDGVPTVLDRLKLDVNGDTLSSKNNIGKTVVRKLGPSALTPKGKGNISDVGLDLTETQPELVVLVVHRLVQLGVRAEREGVERLDVDNVGEKVRTRKDQVLNNQVDAVVGVLSAGNGDVADLLEKHRDQDLSNIVPKLGLESKVTFVVEEQVFEESLDVVTKSDVERVFAKGCEPDLELVEKKFLVGLVLLLEEFSARLSKLLGLTVRILVEDVTGLKKHSVHVVVESGEPFAELRVVLNVGVDLVESRKDVVERLAVGKSFEKGSELDSGVAHGRVVGNGLGRLGALVGNVLSVTSVVLEGVKEPSHGLLVVLVTLAFDDNLKILGKHAVLLVPKETRYLPS